jgi:GNAT superfamily N-acetyltransferase
MSETIARLAEKRDIPEILEMVREFAQGHPTEDRHRDPKQIEAAYFGNAAVGELIVAERDSRVVGMVQWYPQYDMFWETYQGMPEWLFVRKESRGLGIPVAMIALICDRVRKFGGTFIFGTGSEMTTSFLKRYASDAGPVPTFRLSAEAFQQWADLSGSPSREIVRKLPGLELNTAKPQPRQADTD